MKAGKNKLLINLKGKSLLYWNLKSVFESKKINWVGIIGQPHDKEQIINSVKEFSNRVNWINGGKTRQESVRNGLNALPLDASKVLIHDGARCLIQSSLIDKCAHKMRNADAIVLAIKVTDTIKFVNQNDFIENTPDRNNLWAAQTPQGFTVSKLKEAHAAAIKNNWTVTDDASLFERLNWKVKIVEGDSLNIKITRPVDIDVANLFLNYG